MRAIRSVASRKHALLAVAVLVAPVILGGCGRIEEALTGKAAKEAVAAREQAAAAEALAAEKAEALAAAEERAEAEAEAAREALAALERQLAEKEDLLAEKEAQLRRQQELQERQMRLADQQKLLEARERELFEKERELEAREVNIAVTEDELRARAAEPQARDEREPAGDYGQSDEVWSAGAESERATLQPGKVIEVELMETVSSRTHRLGDLFMGRLVQDLRAEDGTLVVAAGAEVEGEVIEVTPLDRSGGRASIGIEFTRILVSPGESIEIRASVDELGADGSKDRKKIIGATIAGAILGRVLGGKGAENAVLGAAAGAAVGSAAVARGKGKDAVIPAGTMIALQLEEVVTVEMAIGGPAEPR